MASVVKELVESMAPQVRLSTWGPEDLVLAQP
jgi:hypothetical protein